MDPKVQEAEQELELVTNMLRESLLANSQGKLSLANEPEVENLLQFRLPYVGTVPVPWYNIVS